jgi:hypothetical protein
VGTKTTFSVSFFRHFRRDSIELKDFMNAFYGVTGALDIFNRADPRMAINSEQEELVRERLIEALPLPARQSDQVLVWQQVPAWQLALAWQLVQVLLLTPVSQPALAWQLLEAQAR